MAGKQITFEAGGKTYTLEYTRKSVQIMERRGFSAEDVTTKPASTLPELFAGAFLAHHQFVKRDVIDKIFDAMPNKPELIEQLAMMYNEPIESMLETSESDLGNLNWTVT